MNDEKGYQTNPSEFQDFRMFASIAERLVTCFYTNVEPADRTFDSVDTAV